VSQIHDLDRKDRIRQALLGTHQTRVGTVEVGEVQILPQPIGTFVDMVMAGDIELDLRERMVASTVLVVDVGFNSVDWASVVQKEVRRGASGTRLEAMSVLIDAAAQRIATEYGGRPQPLAIEAALREGAARSWCSASALGSSALSTRPHGIPDRLRSTPCSSRCAARRRAWISWY
jgi:plasmid segregation protein ParM